MKEKNIIINRINIPKPTESEFIIEDFRNFLLKRNLILNQEYPDISKEWYTILRKESSILKKKFFIIGRIYISNKTWKVEMQADSQNFEDILEIVKGIAANNLKWKFTLTETEKIKSAWF